MARQRAQRESAGAPHTAHVFQTLRGERGSGEEDGEPTDGSSVLDELDGVVVVMLEWYRQQKGHPIV